MKVHVVAVAGTGMGSLAGLLAELGHEVTGSDVAFDPPIGPSLEAWGVTCRRGFSADHLVPRPDLVVVGNVCRKDNVEARAAIDGGLAYTHIAGALDRFLLGERRPLVVAGTHGKTTTSSLCAWILERAWRSESQARPGTDPTPARAGFLIGGIPGNFGKSFRAGSPGAPFVIEGDEYDTAFFEKTAKFLHYRAEVALLTSVEHDHIDIYPTCEEYRAAFVAFISKLPTQGVLVANLKNPVVVELAREAPCRVVYYGTAEARRGARLPEGARVWTLLSQTVDETGTQFSFELPGGERIEVQSPIVGAHNAENALGALAACHEGFGADLGLACDQLAEFRGIKRRQELLGRPRGVSVYDDFAHHPSAVKVTLEALRAHHARDLADGGRLFAVFEPRSATACRALHQREYALAFDAADEILFAPLGRTGIAQDERLDTERLCRELIHRGKVARVMDSPSSIVELLAERTKRGDVVAVLSNGAFDGLHGSLLLALGSTPE